MTRVSESARVTVKGHRADASSPLEDQVQAVYEAARRHALANGFKPYTHQGPYGPKKGLSGPLIMKRLISQVLPGMDENLFNTTYGLISQVLRKTDAAVCVKHPRPAPGGGPTERPTWFIADTMPGNLVIVAINMRNRSAGQTPPSSFDENAFLTNREKYRVTADEAGETQEEAPVTVRRTTKGQKRGSEVAASLRASQELRHAEHARITERVLDEIRTTPVPLAADEVFTIVNRDPDHDWDVSTYRNILNQLVESGEIVKRKETFDERVVRAGGDGGPPKGGAKWLFWIAPGPVPGRTSLPVGIPPLRQASDWTDAAKTQLQADQAAVLSFLEETPRDDRLRGRMLERLDIDEERLDLALRRLIRDGLIYTRSSRYYLAAVRKGPRKAAETQTTPSNEDVDKLPTALPQGNVHATPSAVPDPGDLALIQVLADKLGVQLPQRDDERVAELEQRLASSHTAYTQLQAEADRLRKQVSALRAAIASLE